MSDWLREPLRGIARGAYNRLGSRLHRWRAQRAGVYLDPTVQVLGWRTVRIGRNSVISEGCWLNVNDRGAGTPQLVIGEHSFIGRRNTISPGRLIVLGDFCLTGPECSFLGADHVISDPLRPYVSTGATMTSEMRIGPNCWFGQGVTVLGDAQIGHGSVIGARALVRGTIPPFSLVVGNPARVVRRYDFTLGAWRADASSSGPGEKEYLTMLHEKSVSPRLPKLASGRHWGDAL